MALAPQYAEAIRQWKNDFFLFAAVLMIVDRDSDIDEGVNLVRLGDTMRPMQLSAYEDIMNNRWLYFLKYRRMGLSTIVAAIFFFLVFFTPELKAMVVAHTKESAEEIFAIYKRFYDNLPEWLRNAWKCDTSNVRELKFWHGGRIKVFSARSESARGGGWHLIHASEVAKWPDLIRAVKAIFQTADGNARVLLETTAGGLGEAYQFWNGLADFRRAKNFQKRFYPWTTDPGYRMEDDDSEYVPPFEDEEDQQWEEAYAETYALDPAQRNWLRWCLTQKCLGSLETLDQEYPPTAEVAWQVSGKPYFRKKFPCPEEELPDGLVVYEKAEKWTSYLAGVDTSEGNPDGDKSTVVIVNNSATPPRVVATLRSTADILDFAEDAYDLCMEYGIAFTTIETNKDTSVVSYFKRKNYPHLYIRRRYDTKGQEWTTKLGFNTNTATRPILLNRLKQRVNAGEIDPVCPRLKQELNAFEYSKQGRPDHPPGGRDDLLFGLGLALEGEDQAQDVTEPNAAFARRPRDPAEVVEWEVRTGRLYDYNTPFGDDAPPVDRFDNASSVLTQLFRG